MRTSRKKYEGDYESGFQENRDTRGRYLFACDSGFLRVCVLEMKVVPVASPGTHHVVKYTSLGYFQKKNVGNWNRGEGESSFFPELS